MSPAGSSVTPATYTFRVRILGGVYAPPDGRQIWRELELTGDQTLGDLGEAIPLAFGFDDPHLWSFFLSGKPWDDATEYARSPLPDDSRPARAADRLRIRDVPAGKEFLFLFDYGDEWHFGVQLIRTATAPEPDTPVPAGSSQPRPGPTPVPGGRGGLGRAGRGRGVPGPMGAGRSRGGRGPTAGAAGPDAGPAAGRGTDRGLPEPTGRPRPARPCRRDDPASRRAGPPAAGR